MNIRSVSFFALGLLVAPMSIAASLDKGVRFNSPGVLDLAASGQLLNGKGVPTSALDPAATKQILAAPVLDQEHATVPFSDYLFACPADSKTCVPQYERELIAASSGVVQRDKKRLMVKPTAAPPLVFTDWADPTTKTADGDSEVHWYLGTLPQNGLHQVEVQFGHDAPGSFLINAKNGKAAFVHSGSDIVAVSPDGMRLVTFNPDNPPLTLRVAALDDSGPRLVLECIARQDDRAAAQFKGWRDAKTFDVVLDRTGADPAALRASLDAGNWHIGMAGTSSADKTGFACRTPAQ